MKKDSQIPGSILEKLSEYVERREHQAAFDELFETMSEWCCESPKPIVLLIDEVDTATNNQVFPDFLAQLRAGYIERRDNPGVKTFQSVILAGVTDIKHLKSRMDLVVDYLGEHHVIELKIRRGKAYHEKGEVQLAGYLDSYHLDRGYMHTYSVNKTKKQGIVHRSIDGKRLITATV